MYFQYLIEDASTEILVGEVMKKLQDKYPEKEIVYDTKSFSGIGHLRTSGNLMERKGGLPGLRKKAKSRYSEIGRAKCEWAKKIGKEFILEENRSPSFQRFLNELQRRIETE